MRAFVTLVALLIPLDISTGQKIDFMQTKTSCDSSSGDISQSYSIATKIHIFIYLRAKEKCQRLLVNHWIVIAYAVSCFLLP